ncbi:MAG: PorP/SprF family type IX secretion system membrane protein [Bacteroidetes bacterium]|nr:PorP/SprF family type IX secretion system membrane protein [Bacteroidota bacterium]
MKSFKIITTFLLGMSIALISINAKAQQEAENTMSQYFNNRMLSNVGFTGADGNKISLIQNRSWIGFDGAPVLTSLSGEMNFGLNSAGGLNFISDKSGVLIRTYGVVNYAYRIKLDELQSLRLGASLSFHGDRLNDAYIASGGEYDPVIKENINTKLQYDGDFGIIYKREKLELALSILRIGNNLRGNQDNANLAYAQFAAYYDFELGNESNIDLKPMAMYRAYRNTSGVIDLGMQFQYNKCMNAMAVYQNTGNIRAGAGFCRKGLGEVNLFYNTNTKISNSASQQFEFSIIAYLK